MAETLSTPSLVVPRTGDSSVLTVQDREVAPPGPGQVRVQVAAMGVNFREVYERQGVYPMSLPFVLGAEGAGTVESVGEGVTDVAVGDRVAWCQGPGSGAGYVVLPATVVVPVPDGLDLEVAAAAMLQGVTAHYLVASTYPVQAGETVLAHAVAGGVGQLLVQLVKARGARLVGTAGSPEKAERARALGADHVIEYAGLDTDELAAAVKEANGGEGVHVVYDGVGRTTFDASLKSLRPRGMLVLFGAASGQVPPFEIQRLNSGGSLFLTRPTMGDYLQTRDELTWRVGEILGGLASGELTLEIGGRYPLPDAARAYDDLEGRRTTGKLLLVL
ncbi:quinone oxidoreductase family protein [Lapillicoccus jejuensis]|nr:quinone oxidoreductase [Lapillicoccus jejuensis]